jgi:two-component system response regulator AtoC
LKRKIWIIDDEQAICESLGFALRSDYEVGYSLDPKEGLAKIREEGVDLVLLDLKIGKHNGLVILQQIKAANPGVAVIIMTAFGTEESSVKAMKLGAFTYLSKPLDIDELNICIRQALEFKRLNEDVSFLFDELKSSSYSYEMVGRSDAMQKVFRLIDAVKDIDTNVNILGESGTGKELVARAIHFCGKRREERFVAINCAAIPETLLEEELFGHKRGTFTGAVTDKKGKFALADKGSLFLDEIGDMSLAFQSKLLRVLQNKEFTMVGGDNLQKVDVRIITATNCNLKEMVRGGSFREDLYYRLNVMEIKVPSLRDRKEDIPLLCRHFIERFSREQKKPIMDFSAEARARILGYEYPGNVRQLANIIEHAIILSSGKEIELLALPEELRLGLSDYRMESERESGIIESISGLPLKELERLAIIGALKSCDDKKGPAALLLGISERSLWYKVKEYHID